MELDFMKSARELENQLITFRRELHQIPELGLELPRTSAYVQEKLKEMDIPYEVITNGSGVVAWIGDRRSRPCFLLRSDMDALPIPEETGLPYASANGCMHACGHDLHTAILLGAAKLLKAREDELQGCVKLLFQPAEETFSGAKKVIEDGALLQPQVDAALAMHVASSVPLGVVAYGTNPMSSVYGFRITITGRGGHGSQPDQCVDPINVGVHLHLALQELISRECPPTEHAALTIGQFAAGEAANVIPERAILQGTIRTFTESAAKLLIQRLHQVTQGVAATYLATATVEELSNVPSVVCDGALNLELISYLQDMAPSLFYTEEFHAMGSEDFAYIARELPSSYFALGAAVEDKSLWKGQHNPKVLFHEGCLCIGAASYAQAAYQWLAHHKL